VSPSTAWLPGGSSVGYVIIFTSLPCPDASRIGRRGTLPSPSASASALKVRRCERSLTRVLGSVTLAIDKASKGAWSEKGKGSAAHARGKPG